MASAECGGMNQSAEDNISSIEGMCISKTDPETRVQKITCGDLKDWAYSSPFRSLVLEVERVDQELCPLYIKEANITLEGVLAVAEKEEDLGGTVSVSRHAAFEKFLSLSSLECFTPTSSQCCAPEAGIHAQL